MITSILLLIILVLLINTAITNFEIRRLIKILDDENPDQFKENIQEFKKEYKSMIKRWGRF